MQALFTLIVGAITGSIWLAYFHPSAWSKICTGVGRLAVCWTLLTGGFSVGLSYAADIVTEIKPPAAAAIEALRRADMPTWVWAGPLAIWAFAMILEMFPLIGLTDEARRKELRKKEEATRRPPLWY